MYSAILKRCADVIQAILKKKPSYLTSSCLRFHYQVSYIRILKGAIGSFANPCATLQYPSFPCSVLVDACVVTPLIGRCFSGKVPIGVMLCTPQAL